MRSKLILTGLLLASAPFFNSCGGGAGDKPAPAMSAKEVAQEKQSEIDQKKIDELNHLYSRVPDEGKLIENGENDVYRELKQRYKDGVIQLKKNVEGTGAKLVFVLIAAEVGKSLNTSPTVKYGIPFIKSTLDELGIEYIDFAPIIASKDIKEISQVPKDGHWSKKGAILIAEHIAPIVKKYATVSCTSTFKDTERPETYGDLPPNDDEVLDGGKNMPYHVKANSQGVRMDHDITFPKKKKRVLLMGDSGFFCPFLDNEFTISAVLQQQLPDFEIITDAAIGWTIEDYNTLWNDKTKYTESDIVIVGANGGDIEDLYFTHRNHLSRSHKPFSPSPAEEKYYKDTYKQ